MATRGPIAEPAAELGAALGGPAGESLLVVTGAGVSLASGIATFRGSDPGALWKRDLTELATRAYFQADPVGSWRWYLERFDRVLGAEPNAAHRALVDLERWQRGRERDFLLVTQNVDPLHERAGSEHLVKVHGSADRMRCSRPGCEHGAPRGSLPRDDQALAAFRAAPGPDTLPRCSRCGAILRQHVLWFDEHYQEHEDYQLERVLAAADAATLVLFAGTSFSVGITDLLLRTAWRRGAEVFAVDPNPLPHPIPRLRFLRAPAEVLLPAVVDLL
jgi:NAD-dependent SIR2 family protein deacetylase